ncbi:MAG: DUF4364 family protein [Clostridia bacterium]|nr:DUF4364 family protein [Clostridia bacterium]
MKTYQNGMNDKTDIKVFILFLLDNIDYPLDYDTIHDIVTESGYVGDFDFAECFSKLRELGHILEDQENGVTYYLISPTGKIVSAELQSKLMLSIREKSLKIAMRFLSFRKRNATPSSSIEKREDGKYTFHCEIADPVGKLLSVDICMASRLQAEEMKKKFDKDPEDVYRRLLSVMTWDADYLLG